MPQDDIPDLTPIDGGYCVRRLDDGRCVDVLKMIYNWRLAVTLRPHGRPHNGYELIEAAWCYFGHGDARTMRSAYLAAVAAARVWDGTGDPPGADKRAGS